MKRLLVWREPAGIFWQLLRWTVLVLPIGVLAVAVRGDGARVASGGQDGAIAEWSLPEPFQSVSFAVNGLGGKPWRPEPCVRLGVVSPFCDDQTLSMLAGLASAEKPIFIGRSDELAQVPGATLDGFARVAVLEEMAATEDGEEEDAAALQGLHAKAFIAERGWDTAITVGSGNATRPALLTGAATHQKLATEAIAPISAAIHEATTAGAVTASIFASRNWRVAIGVASTGSSVRCCFSPTIA